MAGNKEMIDLVREQGVVPLFYHDDKEVCLDVARSLYAAGIRFLEFTNRGPYALENFRHLLYWRDVEMPGLLLAIGTIKNVSDAAAFINAGADVIISPGIVKEVGQLASDAGLLWIPGCMTATEIMLAEESGAGIVKLFPGHLLGPGFMNAIRDLFPGLNFMPTGGVEVEKQNLKAWFDAGVVAVGMGSKLISKELLLSRQYNEITRLVKHAMGIISEIRAEK